MDRLRQALDTHHELCDAFDAYLLAETDEDAVGKRSWLAHRFINGGEKAMHALAEAARSVLEAPRIWWCETHNQSGTKPSKSCMWAFAFGGKRRQAECRMVSRLLVDPKGMEWGDTALQKENQ